MIKERKFGNLKINFNFISIFYIAYKKVFFF